jgi:hypothetical protein
MGCVHEFGTLSHRQLLPYCDHRRGQVHDAQDLRRWSAQRGESQVSHHMMSLQFSVSHSHSCSESTWQNILKSVIATIASTSQFVGSHGIDDVAGRLQGLIDGVTEHSNTKSMQLNQEVSKEQLHPEMPNESRNASGLGREGGEGNK